MKNLFYLLIAMIPGLLFSQLGQNDPFKNFDDFHFIKAAQQLEELVDKGDKSRNTLHHLAQSYYLTNRMEKAAQWYAEMHYLYADSFQSEEYFQYLHSLQATGDYKTVKKIMARLAENNSSEFAVDHFSKDNLRQLEELLAKEEGFEVELERFNTAVSDFGPAYFKDGLLFASSRDTLEWVTRNYSWNNQAFLNLFYVPERPDALGQRLVEAFDESLNSIYHDAAPALSPDGRTLYFTRNNYTQGEIGRDKKGTNHLKMYYSIKKDTVWSEPKEVPFNAEGYSVGQPAVSPDGKTLFYVSDAPGGYGMTDIYEVSILDAGEFSSPRNLGPEINSAGREMFPYRTESRLYFASDGFLGFGGLDVFESFPDVNAGKWKAPENLGRPLNSSWDDFALITRSEELEGYFSSNRPGGVGDDDIYRFIRKEVPCMQQLKGQVFRKVTNEPIANASVILRSSQGENIEVQTNSQGEYWIEQPLECEQVYALEASKKGFESGEAKVKTTDLHDAVLQMDLYLARALEEITVKENGKLKIKIDPIYFDLDKSYIRPDAAQELDKIVFVMQEYPDMIIKIESHTDSRGNDDYNEALSDRRAKSTRDYIVSKGIGQDRILSAIGYGEKQLLNRCKNGVRCRNEEHDLNRRSEFIIVKN